MGFYRVVRTGVHLTGITNDMNVSGKIKIPVEIGANQGSLQTVTISANGLDINGTQPLFSPFAAPYLFFDVDTRYLNNGFQVLQARATLLIPQTNVYDNPFLSLASIPVAVNVSNEIFYPNWVTEFTDDLLIVKVSTVHLNADWEVDVFGSAEDYIGTFSGHTSNGEIEVTWNLLDSQGVKREDAVFFTQTTVLPPAPPPPSPPAAPATQLNPPSRKQFDNYPDEGMWTVARLDMIPHHFQNYDLWEQAMNSVAGMAEQHGGVLPLPDGIHRGFGEPFLLRTGPMATNIPSDWTLWLFNGITNRNVRNFYYFGHGEPSRIGDSSGGVAANVIGFYLGNPLTGPIGSTRYRFVWMDGCETANGHWPGAFALGKQENRPLSSYSARPGVFCGYSQLIPAYSHDGAGNGSVDDKAAFFRSEFVFNWHLRGLEVKEAFTQARVLSGWTGGDWLRVYGYWNLRVGEFNRRSQWPPP